MPSDRLTLSTSTSAAPGSPAQPALPADLPTDMPDLSAYRWHRSAEDAAFEGEVVPGLRADYYRRTEGGRVASVGRYAYRDRELLVAWGFADEEHCRRHAVRKPGGGWQRAVDGCPQVELIRDGAPSDGGTPGGVGADGRTVVGLAVRGANGRWVRMRE